MIDTFKCDHPENIIINKEEEQLFYNFCTFITLHKNTKMNVINVFLNLLKNKYERNLFKQFLSVDSDFEVVSIFLKYSPIIAKSKFVTKVLNKGFQLSK